MPKTIGARVDLASGGLPAEFLLFGEDASRVVISCDPMNLARIQEVAGKFGISVEQVGKTVAGELQINVDGQVVLSGSIAELRDGYEGALEAVLKTDPELVAAD